MEPYASPQILEIFRHIAQTARADPAAARQVREALLASGLLQLFAVDEASDLLDLLEAGGEEALRARLQGLGVRELHQVIAQHGFDRDKTTARWRSVDRLIELIVGQVRAHLDVEAAAPEKARAASWML
jgi:hypothetical protein